MHLLGKAHERGGGSTKTKCLYPTFQDPVLSCWWKALFSLFDGISGRYDGVVDALTGNIANHL